MENIDSKSLVSLIEDKKDTELIEKIKDEQDIEEIKKIINLFNLNQYKKNAIRVSAYNQLLDKVSEQMLKRFEKRADEFTNSDLLNYLQVTQNAIDKANKSLNGIDEIPAIQLNQVNVNMGANQIGEESKKRIFDYINAVMNKTKEEKQEEIIEIKPETESNTEEGSFEIYSGENKDETNN